MLRTTASRVANLVRKAVCPPILVGARASAPPLKARLGLEQCESRDVPDGTPTVTAGVMMGATEGGMGGWFFLSRTGDTSGSLTVSYTVGGTATAGADYTALSGTATFAPDNAFVGVFVGALADSIADPDETVVLDVQAGAGYTVGGPASATLTITDTTPVPVVTVEKVADTTEGGVSGTFRFTRTGDTSNALTVSYTVGGTAAHGTDYTALSGTVTFAAGSATADVDVVALNDNGYDPDETVALTVASGTGYAIGAANTASLDIVDSAALTFTLEGAAGGIKCDIPWNDVDPGAASQSLALTNFAITVGTYTITSATPNVTFVTAPTAQFESGEFKGITFEINTTNLAGFNFSSLAMTGTLTLNAIQKGTNQLFQVAAAEQEPAIVIDFKNYVNDGAHKLRVIWALGNGAPDWVEIDIGGATSAGGVRDSVFSVLQDNKLNITPTGETRLVIKGTAKDKLTDFSLTPRNQGGNWNGPDYVSRIKTPTFHVNGVKKSP